MGKTTLREGRRKKGLNMENPNGANRKTRRFYTLTAKGKRELERIQQERDKTNELKI